MKIQIRTIFTSLALLFVSNAFAQEENAPIYKIEVLLFENTQAIGVGGEKATAIENRPTSWDAVSLDTEVSGHFTTLPSSSLHLHEAKKRLNSGDYRVLYHKTWTQPVTHMEESKAVWIERAGQVSGTIHLHKQRYLHVVADLLFQNYEGEFRLRESRKLNSKQLHYLDHPNFGLLIRVVKFE